MVEFTSVSQNYSGILALDHVSFKIKRGEFISIVGPSGAGKSTIIKLLICEESPSTGKIIVAANIPKKY